MLFIRNRSRNFPTYVVEEEWPVSTVSFAVDTRIDHRFAIQTELNDGPYSLSALSLPLCLPTSVVILPRGIPLDRVSTYPLFFREKKKEKKGKRGVVSTVCKSSDQSSP